jgi:hypothetical protein
LPESILIVPNIGRITRFMNHAHDVLLNHEREVHPHEVVMREIHDAVAPRERAGGSKNEKKKESDAN